jgi:hypothetical protein
LLLLQQHVLAPLLTTLLVPFFPYVLLTHHVAVSPYCPPAQVLILDNNSSMRRDEEGVPWIDLPELTHLSLSSCPNLMGYALALYQLEGLQRLGAADNGTAPVGASLDGCTALKVILGGGAVCAIALTPIIVWMLRLRRLQGDLALLSVDVQHNYRSPVKLTRQVPWPHMALHCASHGHLGLLVS